MKATQTKKRQTREASPDVLPPRIGYSKRIRLPSPYYDEDEFTLLREIDVTEDHPIDVDDPLAATGSCAASTERTLLEYGFEQTRSAEKGIATPESLAPNSISPV